MQFFVNYILNIVIKVKWHMLDQIWLNFKIVWNFWWVFENFWIYFANFLCYREISIFVKIQILKSGYTAS